jgi:hypothetical protein
MPAGRLNSQHIRSSDSRIMILQACFDNPLPGAGLENSAQPRCTYCCTRIEISAELAEVIAVWPSLSDRQRQALALLTAASGHGVKSTE